MADRGNWCTCAEAASRPEVGSSANSTDFEGSRISIAIARRLFSPPLIPFMYGLASSPMYVARQLCSCRAAMTASSRSLRSEAVMSARMRAALKKIVSSTVKQPSNTSSCVTNPEMRRKAVGVSSSPSTSMRPQTVWVPLFVDLMPPATICTRLVLPEPLGPSTHIISPPRRLPLTLRRMGLATHSPFAAFTLTLY